MTSNNRLYVYSKFSAFIFRTLHGLGKFTVFILSLGVFIMLSGGVKTLLDTATTGGVGVVLGGGVVQLIFLIAQYVLLNNVLNDFNARKKPISELLLRVSFASIGMMFIALGGCVFIFTKF